MIAKVSQTKANFHNRFEVSDETGVLFYAETPWLEMNLPFDIENVRKLNLKNLQGETVYTTDYSVIDNALEKAIPLKYLFSGAQCFCKYSIIKNEETVGSFYSRRDGFFDTKKCVEFGGRFIYGYDIAKGNFEVICFYENDRQIAQVTKSLSVVDNLDEYHLHIADGKESLLPILAFFVVYYDYTHHQNGGEVVFKKVETSWSYTIDVNNKYYNPDWITQEFGKDADETLRREIGMSRTRAKRTGKKLAVIMLSVILGVAALVVGLVGLISALYQPKTPLNAFEFTEKIEQQGFEVGYVTVIQ